MFTPRPSGALPQGWPRPSSGLFLKPRQSLCQGAFRAHTGHASMLRLSSLGQPAVTGWDSDGQSSELQNSSALGAGTGGWGLWLGKEGPVTGHPLSAAVARQSWCQARPALCQPCDLHSASHSGAPPVNWGVTAPSGYGGN